MKKKLETNINKLKAQRRLNVQEQNILKKDQILNEAKYWRINGIPYPLEQLFLAKGIHIDTSILLNYGQDSLGVSTDEGMVLTADAFFYKFDADLNPNRTALIELYSFVDVSDKFEINKHKKGIGKTYGYLAMEVLKELNCSM